MMRFLCCVLFFFLFVGSGFAQDFSTPLVTNSPANSTPFSATTIRKIRTLYTTADFATTPHSGIITTVYLASASATGGGTWSDFQIWLGQTNETEFSSTAFSPGLTLCLSAPTYTIPSVTSNGYIAFPLDLPFTYDTSRSLIVEISYQERTAGLGFALRSNNLNGRDVAISGTSQNATTGGMAAAQRTLGIDLDPLPNNDVNMQRVTAPFAPFLPGMPTTLSFEFQNAGTATLDSATFHFQVGAGPVVSEHFVGSIASLQNGSFTFATPLPVPALGDSILRVWVSSVNGVPDTNVVNNSLDLLLCLPITAGTYQVGGPNAPFASLEEVRDRLNCSGISGPVIFELAAGDYVGPYAFGSIMGTTRTNTVTFTSASGNPADVRFFTTISNQPALSFTGTFGLNLSKLTFVRSLTSTAVASLVTFSSVEASNLNDLVFEDSARIASSSNVGLTLVSCKEVNLQNSRFTGFGEAIRFNGTTTQLGMQNAAQDLVIREYLINGLVANFEDGLNVGRNLIEDYRGATNVGMGLWLFSLTNANIYANRIGGDLPACAVRLNNLNRSVSGGINLFANNEISGTTHTGNGSTGITRGLWVTGSSALNQRDAVAIVNNTISYLPFSSNNVSSQALIYIDGANASSQPFDTLILLNNNLVEPIIDSVIPGGFAPLVFSHPAIPDSMTIGYNNYYKPAENVSFNLVRILNPAFGYSTLGQWQAAYPADSTSISVQPYFLSANRLKPLSSALDNRGITYPALNIDIEGVSRAATPDIGAYEFDGQVVSQFVFVPLGNTPSQANRSVQVIITDSTGLVTGLNGPRLFYRKQGQVVFQVDSTPVVVGNNFGFTFNAGALGGLQQGDTVLYYFAVMNAGGDVTTLPLGGGGLAPLGGVSPTNLFSYAISRSALGSYTVGALGDFPTLSAAASFINTSIFSETTTFLLIDTLYGPQESFPIVFMRSASRNDSIWAIIRPDSGVVARIEGEFTAIASSLIQFEDANFMELNGAWAGQDTNRLQISSPSLLTSTALVRLVNNTNFGNDHIRLRNLHLLGPDPEVNLQFAIYVGGTGNITQMSEGRHRFLQIEGNRIERIWQGVYVRGLASQPVQGLFFRHNVLGNDSLSHRLGTRGIWLHHADSTLIQGNVMRNLSSGLPVAKVGVLVSGNQTRLRIDRNDIRNVAHTAFTGGQPGAYGIWIQAGTGVEMTNNLIAGMKGGNTGNTSFEAATGIRLSGGSGHRLYYNTVHLYGVYDQPATGAATASALSITNGNVNNLDVRNNIFSNTLSSLSTSAGIYFTALWFVQNYNFSTSNFDHNAYAVANTSQHLLARMGSSIGTLFFQDLPAFRLASQQSNASNDVHSRPVQGKVPAPFVSDLNLHIDTSFATSYESGGQVILSLGVPNVDFNGLLRPAFGGAEPDIGALEFDGTAAGDEEAPECVDLTVTPALNACLPVARSIQVVLTDSTGVASARLLYRVALGPWQTTQFARTAGTPGSGTWTANLPAATAGAAVHCFLLAEDSLGNATDTLRLATTRDGRLALAAPQRDTTLLGSAPLPRQAAGNAGGLLISEVFFSRTAAGGQSFYPFGFPTFTSQVAVELSNSSRQPIDLTGKQLKFEGNFNHVYNLPAIQLDTGAVVVLVAGTSANQPGAGIYSMANDGGSAPFNATSVFGIWLQEAATQEVFDAVSINGHQFTKSSGVGLLDFTGTVNPNNRASILRIGKGLPNASHWVPAGTLSSSSITFYNEFFDFDPGVYTWQLAGSSTVLATGSHVVLQAPVSGTYVLTYTDSLCSVSDSFVVNLVSSDIALTSITAVNFQPFVYDSVEVRVKLKHLGSTSYSGNITLRYQEDNRSPSTAFTTFVNMAPGDSLETSIPPRWLASAPIGSFDLCAFLDALTVDPDQSNDTICITLLYPMSVENSRFAALRLYPNPANEQVNLEGLPEGSRVVVLNMHGQVVQEFQVEATSISFETHAWQAGLYQIRVQSEGRFASRKLMIAR